MIPLTLAEVATAIGGRLDAADPAASITGPVVLDSRQAEPGALFVAVAGEHLDGHDYAVAAVDAGASAVLAARPLGVPAVVVPDVVAGLGTLAAVVLSRLPQVQVIGVTGSSGKTSTKDLLGAILEPAAPTVAAAGSFNNELGLPLTVLRATVDTRHLVLEYSARARGHIAHLCRIAPPHIGVVLNVGRAHVGVFGSRQAIADAKAELVEALPPSGLAVLNADDPLVTAMRDRTRAAVRTVGMAADADVRAADVRLDDGGRPAFTLIDADGRRAAVALRLVGAHHVGNAIAAAAAARHLGVPLADIAAALHTAEPRSRWRMEVHERPDGVVVINDAYNANPESMRAALQALAALGAGRGRTWAVLGEMRELGDAGAVAHREVGEYARELSIDRVVAVGDGVGAIAGEAAPTIEAALELLRSQVRAGDVVLVKASRAAGLERLAEALLDAEVHA